MDLPHACLSARCKTHRLWQEAEWCVHAVNCCEHRFIQRRSAGQSDLARMWDTRKWGANCKIYI
jgi:hypothetical protein